MQASGYLFSVVPVAVATACAVSRVGGAVRRFGTATYVAGFAPSQLPVPVAGYLLASTMLCLAQGELWSGSGLVGLALTVCALAGLGTLVARALRTRRVLVQALMAYGLPQDRPGGLDPLSAIALRRTRQVAAALLVPFLRRRRDVQRLADLAYGAGAISAAGPLPAPLSPRRRAGICLLSRRPLSLGFQEPRGAGAALPAGRKRLDSDQRQLPARSRRVVPRRPHRRQTGPGLGR